MVELGLERQLKEKKKILHKHFFPPNSPADVATEGMMRREKAYSRMINDHAYVINMYISDHLCVCSSICSLNKATPFDLAGD